MTKGPAWYFFVPPSHPEKETVPVGASPQVRKRASSRSKRPQGSDAPRRPPERRR
ncbi:MAG: hypothetical protein MZV49_05985 [Rhodopseudomonas palustris]|nr:hypothetical protein [Rhodopseudomonas palustris]